MREIKFGLFLAVLTVLLVACAQAPTAPKAPAPTTTAPSEQPSAGAPTTPAAPSEAATGKIKLTKYTATKSGTTATVLVGFQNLETTQTSTTVKITLYYAGRAVADKTVDIKLAAGETKDFNVVFENYPQFNAFYVEGPTLVNPLNK